jgi:hypothetical protein
VHWFALLKHLLEYKKERTTFNNSPNYLECLCIQTCFCFVYTGRERSNLYNHNQVGSFLRGTIVSTLLDR